MVSQVNFESLSKKFSALDNKTKLSILALLSEEGTKSVTDVSKTLNINFSTVHKYLEQLEKAGLVKSKQETQSRLKRMFTIQDFSINVSPKGLFSNNRQRTKKDFRIVTERGYTEFFDERKFIKNYLEQGLPQNTVEAGIKYIRRNAYDGITSLELGHLFKNFLKHKIKLMDQTVSTLEEKSIHIRTFSNILNLLHPDALTKHMEGDIFISNLRYPILRNYVAGIRGLSVHGVSGKAPQNIDELLRDLLQLIDSSNKDSLPVYVLPDFNYLIAPLVKKSNPIDVMNALTGFLKTLKDSKYEVFLELDLGATPTYLRKLSTQYLVPLGPGKGENISYIPHYKTAEKLSSMVVDIIHQENIHNVMPIFKLWKRSTQYNFDKLNKFYIANMTILDKDESNTCFAGRLNRFNGLWKGWYGTARVGEMENITLNLPRLASKSKSTGEFFKQLESLVKDVIEFQLNISEMAAATFTRKHDISRPSVQRIRWDYVRIPNSLYSVSVIGLNEAVYLLSGKNIDENPKLGEEILKLCNSTIKGEDTQIRITLKEEFNPLIADRFYYLDSLNNKPKVSKYSLGVGSKNLKTAAIMQKLLPGGHSVTMDRNRFNLKSILDSRASLVRVR